MRIIDADLLIQKINGIGYVPVCVDCVTKHEITEIVEQQPTAYDVNNVVEQLEECQERYDDIAFSEMNENGHTLDFEYAKGKKEGMKEAIEIVKAGGINE